MPMLRMPALMRFYVDNQADLHLNGATVSDVLTELVTRYPAIKTHILDKHGELRRYVNLFINEINIKDLDGINTPVQETDKIILLPSISGG